MPINDAIRPGLFNGRAGSHEVIYVLDVDRPEEETEKVVAVAPMPDASAAEVVAATTDDDSLTDDSEPVIVPARKKRVPRKVNSPLAELSKVVDDESEVEEVSTENVPELVLSTRRRG